MDYVSEIFKDVEPTATVGTEEDIEDEHEEYDSRDINYMEEDDLGEIQ